MPRVSLGVLRMWTLVAGLLVSWMGPARLAWADGPAATPAGTAASAPAPATAAPAASAGDLDFDFLEPVKTPPKEEIEQIARTGRVRRGILTTHQIMGFATLAALSATVVIGHLNYHDMYQSGNLTGRFRVAHQGLAIGTSALFGSIGMLAVFAPNPTPKPIRFDTALVHKISMILATAGMVTQVILGPITVSHAGRLDQPKLALGHVVTGYATWAFMTTGMLSYFF